MSNQVCTCPRDISHQASFPCAPCRAQVAPREHLPTARADQPPSPGLPLAAEVLQLEIHNGDPCFLALLLATRRRAGAKLQTTAGTPQADPHAALHPLAAHPDPAPHPDIATTSCTKRLLAQANPATRPCRLPCLPVLVHAFLQRAPAPGRGGGPGLQSDD